MKSKTNISVVNNVGVRRNSNIIIGSQSNGYASGDILDANAVKEQINKGVASVVDDAPEVLDTLSQALNDLNDRLDTKANTTDLNTKADVEDLNNLNNVIEGLATVATTGNYSDLNDALDIPSIIPDANNHEYVDLGLPSGTLWATKNVGALTEADYGQYFVYGNGATPYGSTEGRSFRKPYNGDILSPTQDTATQSLGENWRMPTREQVLELIDYTEHTWVTDYLGSSKNGYLFTGNNNTMFIPAGGFDDGSVSIRYIGSRMYILSAEYNSTDHEAYYLYGTDSVLKVDSIGRYGCNVRGVITKQKPTSFATVAFSGSYTDLTNKPTIPDALIQSDWALTDPSAKDYIKNKPVISTVTGLISTIYIDESNSDGYNKVQITGDIAVNKDNQGNIIYVDNKPSTKSSSENVISWIRENSRKVHAKYNSNTKALEIMSSDVSNLADDEVDCFMQLPRFWYRCTDESETLHKLEFTHDENIVDSSWNEWNGDTFIGCYKATFYSASSYDWLVDHDTTYLSFVSRGDIGKPNTLFSLDDGRIISRQAGDGFSMVTYDAHKIMEILFYAYYGDVDAQAICGAGSTGTYSSSSMANGRDMDVVPMDIDTKASDNPECNHFWGLCDWWGNVYEWIDDVKVLGGDDNNTIEVEGDSMSSITLAILNYDGSIKRVVRGVYYNDDLCAKKLWGKYADVFPILHTYDYDDYSGGGYTVGGDVGSGPGYVAWRSGSSVSSSGGVGYLGVSVDPDYRGSSYGSRLQYTGPWVEVSSFN